MQARRAPRAPVPTRTGVGAGAGRVSLLPVPGRVTEMPVQPLDQLGLVSLELWIALPGDHAVDAIRDANQVGGDACLLEEGHGARGLLVGNDGVLRAVDEEKGRRAR